MSKARVAEDNRRIQSAAALLVDGSRTWKWREAVRALAAFFGLPCTRNDVLARLDEMGFRGRRLRLGKNPSRSRLRFAVFAINGNRCLCCGWTPNMGGERTLHVDHIEPVALAPERRLDLSNLQLLCSLCNCGKSDLWQIDFRTEANAPAQVPE